ncbi:hypothetical protein AB0N65_13870 [Paenarthrobacter sp. NPDC089322]|uniref:hypothetical protein n=1 Tax=Paenarthrobacter sp. NPDC089322 TaxID=3155065 RepID=UPI003446F674
MRRLPKLILAKDLSLIGENSRKLSEAARAGKLVRIRHGVYVDAQRWAALEQWNRYSLKIEAAAETFLSATVFSHHSAASIHGIPTILGRQPIHALTSYSGGGRSRAGVKRHFVAAPLVQPQEVNGFLVTDPIRTVLDIAASVPFAEAVVPVDFLLSSERNRKSVERDALLNAIDHRYSKAARMRMAAVVQFGVTNSGSPGESYCRGLMHVAGFAAPVLQYGIRTKSGTVYSDYYWEDVRLVGEFDGREKYMKPEYLKGRTASQVVIDEKNRENAIRATGRGVVRLVWSDLTLGTLERELEAAGVPRRRRASLGHPNS